jgi:hypothetical protein
MCPMKKTPEGAFFIPRGCVARRASPAGEARLGGVLRDTRTTARAIWREPNTALSRKVDSGRPSGRDGKPPLIRCPPQGAR